jgi:HlyD family secretion protein
MTRRVVTRLGGALVALACGSAVAGCARHVDGVEAMGTLEVVEVDVAPAAPARVVSIPVDEGAAVRTGDTLVVLTQATLSADIQQRRGRVAAAEAALRDLLQGPRPAELQQARDQLAAAEAEATRTARDFDRLSTLARTQVVSQQQLDAARAAAATAASRRDQARQALRLLEEGTRPERIRAARADVESARAALAAAQATQSDLTLVSPVNGVVLGRHAEPGEVLAPGEPVLTVGDTSRPYVRVYVNQRVLPLVHVGQVVTAALDGLPDRAFRGRVVAINDKAEFTPRVALTEEERADLVFGVKVEFPGGGALLKPGLPITVTIPVSATREPRELVPHDTAARELGGGRRAGST